MNCNMMYSIKKSKRNIAKRIAALAAAILFIVPLIMPMKVSAAGETTADILFVYDDKLSEEETNEVSSAVDLLTYLGYSLRCCNQTTAADLVPDYTSVVFYHTHGEIYSNFSDTFAAGNANIFTFGGGDMTRILNGLDSSLKYKTVENTAVSYSYLFGSNLSEGLTSIEKKTGLVDGKADYTSGSVFYDGKNYPYCFRSGRYTNLSVYNGKSDVMRAAFAIEIAKWLWPFNNPIHSYAQYVVINNVYPYTSPSRITEIVDLMKRENMPFVLAVTPIYSNGDYPATRRFCEALTYAQANGAAVAIKEPITNDSSVTLKDIDKSLTDSFKIFTDNGVYPAALVLNEKGIHDTLSINVMKRFKTVILEPSANEGGWTEKEIENTIYKDGHQIIAPALTDGGASGLTSAYASAVFIDVNKSSKEIDKFVNGIKDSSIPTMSLWASPQTVYTDDSMLSYEGGSLNFNKKSIKLTYSPFKYDENYDYRKGLFSQAVENMANGNGKLIILVSVISVVFIILIVLARLQNRSKFIIKHSKNEEKKK